MRVGIRVGWGIVVRRVPALGLVRRLGGGLGRDGRLGGRGGWAELFGEGEVEVVRRT